MEEELPRGERARLAGSGGAVAALGGRGVERVGPATEQGLGGSAAPARGATGCPGAGELCGVPGPWQAGRGKTRASAKAGRAQLRGEAGRSPGAAELVRLRWARLWGWQPAGGLLGVPRASPREAALRPGAFCGGCGVVLAAARSREGVGGGSTGLLGGSRSTLPHDLRPQAGWTRGVPASAAPSPCPRVEAGGRREEVGTPVGGLSSVPGGVTRRGQACWVGGRP